MTLRLMRLVRLVGSETYSFAAISPMGTGLARSLSERGLRGGISQRGKALAAVAALAAPTWIIPSRPAAPTCDSRSPAPALGCEVRRPPSRCPAPENWGVPLAQIERPAADATKHPSVRTANINRAAVGIFPE